MRFGKLKYPPLSFLFCGEAIVLWIRLQKHTNAHPGRSKWKTEMLRVCVSQLSHLLCQYTSDKQPRHSISNVQCCSTEISGGYDSSSSRNSILSRRRCGLEIEAYVIEVTQKPMSNFKSGSRTSRIYAPQYRMRMKNTQKSKQWILFGHFS